MPYKLSYEHPHFPQDHEVAISGLGRIPNGGTLEVTEEMERDYVASRGMTIEDALTNNAEFSLSGSSSLSPEELEQLLPAPAPEQTTPEPATEQTQPLWVTETEGGDKNA